MKTSWEAKLSDLIPQDVDLLFTGQKKPLCSRQAIVNFIRAVVKEEKEKLSNFYEDQIEDLRKLADLERDSKK